MKYLFFFVIWASVVSAGPLTDPDLSMKIDFATDSLNTEIFWRIEPAELNPHRKNWAVLRHFSFDGFQVVQDEKSKKFKTEKGLLTINQEVYLRASGPTYSKIEDFTCEPKPNEWFSTEVGSRFAAERAANLFQEFVKNERLKFFVKLEKEQAPDAETLNFRVQQLFNQWKAETESHYRAVILQKAREEEWKTYLALAKEKGVCHAQKASHLAPRWEALMEPPAENLVPTSHRKVMARAPARRLNGLYVVRLAAHVLGNELLGQFLVDTQAPRSVASPIWFKNQGVRKELIDASKVSSGIYRWSGGSKKTSLVKLPLVSLSGIPVTLNEFALIETEVYTPLKSLIPCCDGALGVDFFRQYVAHFEPNNPGAMLLWQRRGFALPPNDFQWVEASVSNDAKHFGRVESSCHLESKSEKIPVRAFWSLSDEGALSAIDSGVAMRSVENAELFCGSMKVASGIQQIPVYSRGAQPPAVSVGMLILGRGEVVFDLPHGRIWFEKKGLFAEIPKDRSGLVVKYSMDGEGARELRVTKILKNSPAEKVSGLKIGTRLTKIQGKAVEEMTLWDVQQYLSGVWGSEVTLEWAVDDHFKTAPLNLKNSLQFKR